MSSTAIYYLAGFVLAGTLFVGLLAVFGSGLLSGRFIDAFFAAMSSVPRVH